MSFWQVFGLYILAVISHTCGRATNQAFKDNEAKLAVLSLVLTGVSTLAWFHIVAQLTWRN